MSDTWTRDQLARESLTVSKVLCFVTMLLPLLTGVGWLLGIPLLTEGRPTLPAMQPNAALGLFLAALAVLFIHEGATGRGRAVLTVIPALAVLVLGVLTLGEYAFGWDIGIDRMLVHPVATPGQPYTGRPSPQTSLNFALLGAALLWVNVGVRQLHVAQAAAVVVGANAVVAVTGYVFGTAVFFGSPVHAPAVPTAIGFILLVFAFVCARPNHGMMTLVTSETQAGGIARRILLAGAFALPLVGTLTKLGVVAGWYDVSVQVSLFALAMIGLILGTTWGAARRSEQKELLARTATEALERANVRLSRVIDEREVFAALIENSSDFIGIADPNGKPLYLNPAGRGMVGLAAEFPVGDTHIPEYYSPDQQAFASDVIVKSMLERGHWEGETAFRHWQTGKAIPVWDTHFMIRSQDNGQILGMGTVTRDISEIKRTREEIEDVARASKSVSEAVAGLPESSVLAVLQTIALKAQGLTSAEFAAVGIGSNPDRPFDTFAFVGLTEEQAKQIGRPPRPVGLLGLVAKECSGIRLHDVREHPEFLGLPSHHPHITSLIGIPIRNRGNAVGSLYVANKRGGLEFTPQDQVLAQMLAESVGVAIENARLYAAEGLGRAWLETVVDQMPEGVVLMDANGRVTVENRYVRSLAVGESSQRTDRFGNRMTLDLRRLTGESLLPDDLPIVKALLEEQTTHEHELVARRADGRLVSLLVRAAPIRAANGVLAGATMILQDVSILKELEHLREEWASIVAHDLQQPIHTILLRSDLLLRGPLDNEQAENVRQVRVTAEGLSRMVTDLMDASQLEANRMRIELNRVNVGELVRDIVERIPDAQPSTRIRTSVDGQLFVRGDAQRLEQIIANLISNALKYSEPGAEIQVEVGGRDENAEVSVTNRGPGIPADELPIVFERYGRSRASKVSRKTGLGLGLYIAKGLVQAHGGRIWAESVPGETTTFQFTIPLDRWPAPAAPSPLESDKGAARVEGRAVQP